MATESSIQSLDRGLTVLKILSRNTSMTATAIAAELGVHQSSASRLLNSLLKAGFVRKPDFHSFALDYGALSFAGHAISCFPEIKICTTACNLINNKHGFSAAVGILREGRVLYLTQISDSAAIAILDDSGFPLHQSSLGLALACEKDREQAEELITESILRIAQNHNTPISDEQARKNANEVYTSTRENLDLHGLFYQTDSPLNVTNAAIAFDLGTERAALAIYHPTQTATVGDMRRLLTETVEFIRSRLG